MELVVGGLLVSDNPNEVLISSKLNNLKPGSDAFAILSKDEMNYIQTAIGPGEQITLEYQDGSTEEHFRCVDQGIDLDKVINAFILYLHSDEQWKRELSWEKVEI